ncbi:nudix hydrolase 20 [Marasmius fiardii PR-910]|nr:nudix hydrolase 20 [Marasmius fiardii PR-910]
MSKPLSFLQVVDICDNCRMNRPSPLPNPSPFDTEKLIPWCLSPDPSSPAIGLLRPVIIDALKLENKRNTDLNQSELWNFDIESSRPRVTFQAWVNTVAKRTNAMKELCERWRDTGLFPDVCGPTKWRAEMYPVYRDPLAVHDYPAPGQGEREREKLNYAFEMERSACALFGVVTYGVHMSAFFRNANGNGLQIWVPTRAKTKQTFPGLLDNTVAGGIPSGMGVFESMVKECMEEASIPEDVVKKYTKACGSISYFFRTSKGWLQPEIEYVFNLEIPISISNSFQPKPSDGEVEFFELLDQDEVVNRMKAGVFKPNCALVIIDLLIRLGYITPDNEPDYQKIITRLHGNFDYDLW